MAAKSPLALVKETFGDKAKLVEAVEKLTGADLWVTRTNKDKGLARVSNAKLLRLHATFAHVKEKFGTREKLIDAILDLLKRSKDTGLRQRLSGYPVPRLYDEYESTAKRLGAGRGSAAVPSAATHGASSGVERPAAAPGRGQTPKPSAGAGAKPKEAKKTAKKAGAKAATSSAKQTAKKKTAKAPTKKGARR
jgi:hypothetical protein